MFTYDIHIITIFRIYLLKRAHIDSSEDLIYFNDDFFVVTT